MKKFAKIFLFVILFIYTLVVFLPKKELYYLGERYLAKYKVYISNETLSDLGIAFFVKDGTIYYEGINGGKVESISVILTLLYNKIEISDVAISDDLKDLVPGNVKSVSATYGVWLPHLVSLEGNGEFGEFDGDVNLIERKVKIVFNPSKEVETKFTDQLRRFLKKTEEGYLYERPF